MDNCSAFGVFFDRELIITSVSPNITVPCSITTPVKTDDRTLELQESFRKTYKVFTSPTDTNSLDVTIENGDTIQLVGDKSNRVFSVREAGYWPFDEPAYIQLEISLLPTEHYA